MNCGSCSHAATVHFSRCAVEGCECKMSDFPRTNGHDATIAALVEALEDVLAYVDNATQAEWEMGANTPWDEARATLKTAKEGAR